MEKLVKIKDKQIKMRSIKTELIKSLEHARKAYILAKKTAYCCECSLEDTMNELKRQLENVNNHLKDGILEGEIINGKN